MTTITVWLLVSIGVASGRYTPTTLVERFPTLQECSRVADVIYHSVPSMDREVTPLRCIQATVAK